LPHQILAATQTRLRQEVQQYTAALLFPITGNFVFFRLGVNSISEPRGLLFHGDEKVGKTRIQNAHKMVLNDVSSI